MKNKEEILKKYSDKIREAIYQQELKPVYRPVFTNEIQNILYEALTKTREEIIREVLELVRDLDIFGYPAITKEEYKEMINDILNKLKK